MIPVVYDSGYVAPLPEGHRFPMPKFGMLHDLLCREGITTRHRSIAPEPPSPEVILLVHSRDYLSRFTEGELQPRLLRRIGLPWSEALVHRTFLAVGGTLVTAQLALRVGIACNSAGGTHHAHPGFGSGFCILNDLSITARYLIETGTVQRVLIVDLDVHQGDGTAAALAGIPGVFTFSIHCESNFPFRKVPGDRDIGLPDGVGDEAYLRTVNRELLPVLASFRPDLILYDAGVDVYRGDRLGRLDLSLEGIVRRDRAVLSAAKRRGIPVAAVIGGGYDRDLGALSSRHATVFREAERLWTREIDW